MDPLFLYKHFDLEVYDRLCAFNLFCSHGYETAVSIYPEQAGFILQHMDKTLEEVRRQCYTQQKEKGLPAWDDGAGAPLEG